MNLFKILIFLSFILTIIFGFKFDKIKECPDPYGKCNSGINGMINVHIVPHTHDDVGWLKTVDQYYYRANEDEQDAGVQFILDTVIDELNKDPNKRFVYVEIAYFYRWWNQQNFEIKEIVRNLVNEKRLEFVIGAWCMNDEATTYYNDIIDQQSLGLKFILDEFGECARPRSAWQVDPFGHSREQASLFAQFGFDGLFLGRVDYQDKDIRGKNKTREMLWQASRNLGKAAQLFTGILHNGYGPPDGFCFDQYCDDQPIMDDPNLEDYNVDQKVEQFINYTLDQAKSYKTNNLIMTMGEDFQYSNAHMWFKNLDKLIYYVNQAQSKGSNVNIFYSTTACYLYSLNQANTTWTVKYDDFFPYAHRPHSFWTGYFTSRAALKNYVRRSSNILQSVRHLTVMANLYDQTTNDMINNLERALGVAQHHDAVSGTERQHVANDYSKRLSKGIDLAIYAAESSLFKLKLADNDVHYCSLLNISQCNVIENVDNFSVILYNPLPRKINYWVSIPTTSNDYEVKLNENIIESEFTTIMKETFSIPERNSTAVYNLVFNCNIEPLQIYKYSVNRISKKDNKISKRKTVLNKNKLIYKKTSNNAFYVKNDYLKLYFLDGNLIQIDNLQNQLTTHLNHSFCIYQSMEGNNSQSNFQASGAYIFRPKSSNPDCLFASNYSIYIGKQFIEIYQTYNNFITQTIKLYYNLNYFSTEWQIGPIDVDDNIGKEIVVNFQTDLQSNSRFYTDSNGREILERIRDFRPTWDFKQTEPISGNYYPINSRIFIQDYPSSNSFRQFTVVTDRSQGGSSIQNGGVEIMLHRRLLHDDDLGVSEPLNEKGSDGKGLIVRGTLNIIFNSSSSSARIHREVSHQTNNQPLILFTDISQVKQSKNKNKHNISFSSLPSNLHLLTLLKYSSDLLLVRIEHFYELSEDPILSNPVTIDLKDFLSPLGEIYDVKELALGGNMLVDDLNERLKWNTQSSNELDKDEKNKTLFQFQYTFNPMQIRTFLVEYFPNDV